MLNAGSPFGMYEKDHEFRNKLAKLQSLTKDSAKAKQEPSRKPKEPVYGQWVRFTNRNKELGQVHRYHHLRLPEGVWFQAPPEIIRWLRKEKKYWIDLAVLEPGEHPSDIPIMKGPLHEVYVASD